jgi:acetyl coenzyme A synthetase (ADP forming)-like protein
VPDAGDALGLFFRPAVVAVVGAGHERGGIGAEIFHNLLAFGFRGRVVAVNRRAPTVQGQPTYPSVSTIPEHVDLAIVAVPTAAVDSVVDDCIAARVGALLVITAGFAETGDEGRERQQQLLARVRAAGIRMIGPNCMGLINTDPDVRLNATFAPVPPPAGRLALSTQSGALGLAMLEYAAHLGIGFSTYVSIGNRADVSGNDLIRYWRDDPRTDAILLYVESFGNPGVFRALAEEVSRRKPIVAVKAGRSKAGARAAMSHTGALASSDAVVDALFRQTGVIRTTTIEELFDVAALVAHQPVPAGPRVAILTNAGGPAIMAADACESHGLMLPSLSDATTAALREFLPSAASVHNPVDMLAAAPPEHYARAARLLLADESVDSLIVIFVPPLLTPPDAVAAALVEGVTGTSKTVLASFTTAGDAPPALGRIPCFAFPESATLALARVAAYGSWLRRPMRPRGVPAGVDIDRAHRVVQDAVASGEQWMTPSQAGELLDAAGITRIRSTLATTDDDAVAAAHRIGYPVAVKASGPDIIHKTELGGVRLDLADDAGVRAACHEMRTRLGERLHGYVVQSMSAAGVDMLIGISRDPTFGPVVACATGGTLAQLFADVSLRLPPLSSADAEEMIDELRGAQLLRGYRGAPPVDASALAEAICRLAAIAVACPELIELDINPLRVLPSGVCALDIRVRVGGTGRELEGQGPAVAGP